MLLRRPVTNLIEGNENCQIIYIEIKAFLLAINSEKYPKTLPQKCWATFSVQVQLESGNILFIAIFLSENECELQLKKSLKTALT